MPKQTIQHIMVVADGSEAGFRAAALAISLTRSTGARLTAISIIDTETLRQLLTYRILVSQEMQDFEGELESSARQYLERVRTMAMDEKVAVDQLLVRGPYHQAVLSQQSQLAADLLVMAGYKSSRATKDLLAREYQKITDDCPCPVLLVK